MRLDTPRVPPLEESEWTDEVRELLGVTKAGAGAQGRILNIFRTLAHHPKLLKRWLVFGTHVLIQSSLPVRDRELVILRIGWLCRAEYEWAQHRVIALGAGVTEEEIERVAQGPEAPGWSEREAALLRATDELHADAFVSDATWKQLETHLDRTQLMDLVFAVGQYNLVSMALNTFGVQLDPGIEGFPQRS